MVLEKTTILTNWQAEYAAKLTTASEAVKLISSDDTVYIQSHAAAPEPLINAMVERSSELSNVKIVQIMTLGDAAYSHRQYSSAFKFRLCSSARMYVRRSTQGALTTFLFFSTIFRHFW